MRQTVTVESASRLHFGMFSFGLADVRQFGGVGLMVDQPRVRIVVEPAAHFSSLGRHAERAADVSAQVARHWLGGQLPSCRVQTHEAPLAHQGLGLGTQLTLAVAVGLLKYSQLPSVPHATEIAVRLGRAGRSSVGTHGFERGGLIVEAGHAGNGQIGPLVQRVELPLTWRVLLVTPKQEGGLSGSEEMQAFQELPPVPVEVTRQLAAEALLELLPAAQGGDFVAFCRSVYRFGKTAGACFAAAQGGAYSRAAGPLIERLRSWGVEGVGQSSWGPTVFAFTESDADAERLRARLERQMGRDALEITVSQVANRGASVYEQSPPTVAPGSGECG